MPLTADQVLELATIETPDPVAIQALIDGALKESVDAEVLGLKNKNSELLGTIDSLKPLKELGKAEDIKAKLEERAELKRKLEAMDAGVEHADVEALAKKQVAEEMERFRLQIADARKAETERAEQAEKDRDTYSQKYDDEHARRRMRLSSRGIIDGLEEDVFNRLRQVYSRDPETGAMVLVNPETGARLQGESGDMTDDELFAGLAASNGTDAWNSKGAGYFSSNGQGGGEGEQHRRIRGAPKKERSKMSRAEKSAFIADHGEEAFRALPK